MKSKNKFYSSWKEAKKAAIVLGIKSATEYVKKHELDPLLPAAPQNKYKSVWTFNRGWRGFLCTKVTPSQFKEARKNSNLTLDEAGRLLDVSRDTVAQFETGDKHIDVSQYKLVFCFRHLATKIQVSLCGESFHEKLKKKVKKPVVRRISHLSKTERIIKAHKLIINSYDGEIDFKSMCKQLNCSQSTLYRMINELKLLDRGIYIEKMVFKYVKVNNSNAS